MRSLGAGDIEPGNWVKGEWPLINGRPGQVLYTLGGVKFQGWWRTSQKDANSAVQDLIPQLLTTLEQVPGATITQEVTSVAKNIVGPIDPPKKPWYPRLEMILKFGLERKDEEVVPISKDLAINAFKTYQSLASTTYPDQFVFLWFVEDKVAKGWITQSITENPWTSD